MTGRIAVLGLLLGIASVQCSSDGVGIEDCRRLENVHCQTAQACGTVSDVAACKRFYRDQCLRGFALSASPPASDIQSCSTALEGLGACARDNGKDSSLEDCSNSEVGRGHDTRITSVCDGAKTPEHLTACAFLVATAASPDAGTTGGASGTGGVSSSGGESPIGAGTTGTTTVQGGVTFTTTN